jgi:ribosomal protein S18 acetylase RimI-like enzyme
MLTSIRPAILEDAAAIARVRATIRAEDQAFLSDETDLEKLTEAEHDRLELTLPDEACLTLVLTVPDGTVAGWASFEPGPHRKTRHWGLVELAILACWRGQGHGGRLLGELLRSVAANAGIECVRLDCASSNGAAIQFFSRFGFVEEGRLERAIRIESGGYADIVKMRRYVRSV